MTLVLAAPSVGQLAWREIPEFKERYLHAMAYDPVRERVVMFGGTTGGVLLADTWEWDGREWRRIITGRAPEARFGQGMAYDPTTRRVILFGGWDGNQTLFGDTWAWDGREWTRLSPTMSPAPRAYLGMGSDPIRGTLILFGGGVAPITVFGPTPIADTWEWTGQTWRQHQTATRPAAGSGALAFCQRTGRVTMIQPGVMSSTWEWHDTNWAYVASGLPVGSTYDVATDPNTGCVLVYVGANNQFPNETYLWDGTTWARMPPSATPLSRDSVRIACDEARKQVILYGLDRSTNELERDTWAWDGTSWKKAWEWPALKGVYEVAHDAARDQLLMYGGGAGAGCFETWTLDERGFRNVSPPVQPFCPTPILYCYHAGLGRAVVAGERQWGLPMQTLSWDGQSWVLHPSWQAPPMWSGIGVYDSARDKLVFLPFRGTTSMWDWDPTNGWTQLPVTPPTSLGTATAYDPVRRRIVAFTYDINSIPRSETWEYDGTSWAKRTSATRPPYRGGARLEYVPALAGVVLFGGSGSMQHTDSWLWDGSDWKQLPVTLPVTRSYGVKTSAYDAGRQRVVALAHIGLAQPANATWELSVESLRATYRYPRLGERIVLDLDMPREAGWPWLLGLSHANQPGIPLRNVPGAGVELLPLAPGPLLNATLQLGIGGILDAQGRGSLPLTMPSMPWLLGTTWHAGAFTLRPGPRVGAISNGVGLEIIR